MSSKVSTESNPSDFEFEVLDTESARFRRKRLRGEGGVGKGASQAMSTRFTAAQIELLDEIVACSHYETKSEYIRHAALGLDNDPDVVARAGVIVKWLESHEGETIGETEWDELSSKVNRVFSGSSRPESEDEELDLSELLEAIANHLLDVAKGQMGKKKELEAA